MKGQSVFFYEDEDNYEKAKAHMLCHYFKSNYLVGKYAYFETTDYTRTRITKVCFSWNMFQRVSLH